MKHHPSRVGLTEVGANGAPVWNGEVRFNRQWLDQPLRWRRPRKIFVCAHGDLFHESVPDDWIDEVFAVMALAPHHQFQVLTKRHQRMHAYFENIAVRDAMVAGNAQRIWHARTGEDPSMWLEVHLPLPNVWLGVSVESQKWATERVPWLLRTPAAVRFASVEPLLGPVSLRNIAWGSSSRDALDSRYGFKNALDWVIVGGESGPKARPMHPDWARSLRDQCVAAGVAFHFKQWGEWGPSTYRHVYYQRWAKRACYVDASGHGATKHITPDELDLKREGDLMSHFGKKYAGRLLDGRTWDEWPAQGEAA